MDVRDRGCLEDPRELWDRRICLHPVSKNLRGELKLMERERQDCEEQRCRTLKTDHLLRFEDVRAHEPCDSEAARALDGRLFVRRLVTAFADGSGENRGLHTGGFVWVGAGARVVGTLSGMTNVGTHRQPVFQPCQQCHQPGVMEGRLCGRIVRARDPRLRGCRVTAAYRFSFDASEGAIDTAVTGTLEGLIVCGCGKSACLELAEFPPTAHRNPWTVSGTTFHVHDFDGSPAATADIVTWGGFTGLNVGFETVVTLPSPVDEVDITLVHFAQPATVEALDGGGAVVDSATMTAPGGTPETLHLSSGGIASLVVRAPQDETLILRLCTS